MVYMDPGGCPQRLLMLSGTAPAVMTVHIRALCMGSAAQRYRWPMVSAVEEAA